MSSNVKKKLINDQGCNQICSAIVDVGTKGISITIRQDLKFFSADPNLKKKTSSQTWVYGHDPKKNPVV